MQPFPSPAPPERRGSLTLIALLLAALIVAVTIAVVEFVQLRAATDRIEELEAADGSGPGRGEGQDGGGGPFGDVGDLIEDLLDDVEGLFDGGAGGELGSLLECLGDPLGGIGEAGTTVEAIAAQVETIRELRFEDPVEPTFLGDAEMTARVRELFLEEYTPRIAELEQRLLTTLGAIPRGTDLRQLRADAIGQQVAGFYEPETGELVIREAGGHLSAIDRITLAHELDHALTDQVLDIPLPDDPDLGREDANLAALALVEGDATLVMQRYASTLGFGAQLELLDPAAIAQQEAGLESFPHYLEQELLFPYEQGLSFVCELYASGGWDAVNGAYANPPTSTSQILFPERYLQGPDEPVDPPDASAPGKGWKLDVRLQLGPANLLWLFEAPGGDPGEAIETPMGAAAALSGGEAHLWSRGARTALGISVAERPGVERLCRDLSLWYSASFSDDRERRTGVWFEADGPVQDAVLNCMEEGQVTLGIAPALPLARTVAR